MPRKDGCSVELFVLVGMGKTETNALNNKEEKKRGAMSDPPKNEMDLVSYDCCLLGRGAMTKNILLRRTLCSTSSSATTPRIRYFGKPDRSKYLPFAPCNSLKLSQEELERLPPQVRQVLEPKYWDGRTYLKANIWNAVLEFQRKPGDTGSAEVQVAVLTKRMEALEKQCKRKKDDTRARYLLDHFTSRRQRLLQYLARQNKEHCAQVMARLGLEASAMFPKDNGQMFYRDHPMIRFGDMKTSPAKPQEKQTDDTSTMNGSHSE
jgi:small subunit ribosomal protein S15